MTEFKRDDAAPVEPEDTPAAPAPAPVPSSAESAFAIRKMLFVSTALLTALTLGVLIMLGTVTAQMFDMQSKLTAIGAQLAVPAPAAVAPAPAATAQAADPNAVTDLTDPTPIENVALANGQDQFGALLIGNPDASNVLEVFVDYQCPYCQKWEQSLAAPLIAAATADGSDLLIKQYNMAFLKEANGELDPAGASARAANAVLCVADADGTDVSTQMSETIFAAADPAEPDGQFPTKQLVKMAKGVGASDKALSCIEDETFVPAVAATTQGSFGRGVKGTPAVTVNGKALTNPFEDPALTALLSGN